MYEFKKVLSRKERMKKNPVGWIILFIILAYVFSKSIVPDFLEWQEKRTFVLNNETLTQQLEKDTKALKEEHDVKLNELENFSREHLLKEVQIFPKNLDIARTAQILEIYSLQLENLDTRFYDSRFSLESIDFGNTRQVRDSKHSETSISIKFVSDFPNFKEFVLFLQTGEFSDRFEEGKTKGQIQINDYTFLTNNLLPLLHIESIDSNPIKEGNDSVSQLSNVSIKAKLFSQN